MQLGELFFSLGFKSTGTGEVQTFEKSIDGANQAALVMQDTMSELLYILEQMAYKMGALTGKQLEQFRIGKEEKRIGQMVNQNLKETNLGKQKQSGILSTLNQKMRSYWGNLGATRIQLMAVAGGLTWLAKKAGDVAVNIDKLSSFTGMSTDSMQRLGDMAAQVGGNVDDIAGAIQGLQKQSTDIMLGKGGNVGVYQFLGLNPHDDPVALLGKLSAKLKTMPMALGMNMARDLGLSDDVIYLLKNTDNIKPPREETIITEKEVKRLKDFTFNFNRVWEQGKRVLTKFAALLMPIVNQVVYGLDRVGMMFGDLTNKMQPFLGTIERFMPVLVALGAILFAAFFPLTATIIALGLALEDFWAFSRGDDSMIGRMIAWFSDLNNVIEKTIYSVGFLANMLTGGAFEEQILKWTAGAKTALTGMLGNRDEFMAQNTAFAANAAKAAATNVGTINVTVNESKTPGKTAEEIQEMIRYGGVSDALYQQPMQEKGGK
jgi:hypothetical protein